MESTAAATDTPPYLQQTFNIYEGDNYGHSTINGGTVGGVGNTNRAEGVTNDNYATSQLAMERVLKLMILSVGAMLVIGMMILAVAMALLQVLRALLENIIAPQLLL